jgi:diguanylate cyclase (GGDEF)-like protein
MHSVTWVQSKAVSQARRASDARADRGRLGVLKRENAMLRRMLSDLEELRELAFRDALTGIHNRRFLDTKLARELGRARKSPRRAGCLLLLDLDRFKRINDVHGHAAGDQALQFFARFLLESLRRQDVCCRTGGDEFMVILPDTTPESGARVVKRLKDKLAAANAVRPLKVEMSLGMASWPLHGCTPEELERVADDAMYTEKRSRAVRLVPDASERAMASEDAA